MRRNLDTVGMLLGWFALVTQFVLMMYNRQADVVETVVRFFSFFTILTNLLVAVYFTWRAFGLSAKPSALLARPSTLTAVTTFILIVGLVYQFVLRGTWQPQGMQRVVDELLHTVIPAYVLVYWWLFGREGRQRFRQVAPWLAYPITYLGFVLARGSLVDYFPYPFLDLATVGTSGVAISVLAILVVTLLIMGALLWLANLSQTKAPAPGRPAAGTG